MKRVVLTIIAMMCSMAIADELELDPEHPPVEHPAFGTAHTSKLSVQSEVPDIKKLEAKAVSILRTKHGLTLAEARAQLRIDGKTDVARCLEVVIIAAVSGITQVRAVDVLVENQHPVEHQGSEPK